MGLTGNTAAAAAAALLATVREEADLDAVCLLERDGKPLRVAVSQPGACDLAPEDLAVLAALGGGDSAHTPVRRAPDGTPYLLAFAPLRGDRGPIVAVRASAPYLERLDVEPANTLELEALQQAFARMSVLIRAREQSLRALAGGVAHEVRNPAHALRLHLGLLRRELHAAYPGWASERIDTLHGLLDELDATVESFLLFAQDRAPRRQAVSLRALLQRAADGAEIEASDVLVNVDPVLVGRAVSNLVRNAVQVGSARVLVRATAFYGVRAVRGGPCRRHRSGLGHRLHRGPGPWRLGAHRSLRPERYRGGAPPSAQLSAGAERKIYSAPAEIFTRPGTFLRATPGHLWATPWRVPCTRARRSAGTARAERASFTTRVPSQFGIRCMHKQIALLSLLCALAGACGSNDSTADDSATGGTSAGTLTVTKRDVLAET